MATRSNIRTSAALLTLTALMCTTAPSLAAEGDRYHCSFDPPEHCFNLGPDLRVLGEGDSTVQRQRDPDRPNLAPVRSSTTTVYRIAASSEVTPALDRTTCRHLMAVTTAERIAQYPSSDPLVLMLAQRFESCASVPKAALAPEGSLADCRLVLAAVSKGQGSSGPQEQLLSGVVRHCNSVVREAGADAQSRKSGFTSTRR